MESVFQNPENFCVWRRIRVASLRSGLSIRIIRYSLSLLKNYQFKYDACEYSRLSSTSQLRPLTDLISLYVLFFQFCVANVSVRYSEQRTRNESQRQREKWSLVSFLALPKPKIPFLSRSLLLNQTETLATQATLYFIRVIS